MEKIARTIEQKLKVREIADKFLKKHHELWQHHAIAADLLYREYEAKSLKLSQEERAAVDAYIASIPE